MIGIALKKFARERGMKFFKGVAYGRVNGYIVTLSDRLGYKKMSVYAPFETNEDIRRATVRINEIKQNKYRITDITTANNRVEIVFRDTIGTLKRMKQFEEKIFEILDDIIVSKNVCAHCEKKIDQESEKLKLVNGTVCPYHEDCSDKMDSEAQERKSAHADRPYEGKRYLRGFAGALLGALVGAIPWAVVYYFGWYVGWLGFLIGLAAKKGYELLGGRAGKGKLVIIILTTVIGVVFGQLLGDAIFLAIDVFNNPYSDISSYLYIPKLLYILLTEPTGYLQDFLISVGMGLIFAFLGIISVIKSINNETHIGSQDIRNIE